MWFESKTKLGAFLLGVSALVGTLGSFFVGDISLQAFVQEILVEIGSVLAVFGIRDWEIIRKKR